MFFDVFWCFFDAFSHLFSYEHLVVVLLVFLRIFRTLLIALVLENEHLVSARRSFSENHLFPFGAFFRWKKQLQIKGKQGEHSIKNQLKYEWNSHGKNNAIFNDLNCLRQYTRSGPRGDRLQTTVTILAPFWIHPAGFCSVWWPLGLTFCGKMGLKQR